MLTPSQTDRDSKAPTDAESHGFLVLAVLCALMGFASISTDFDLPATPTMARAPRSDAGAMEMTISGYPIGFSLGQLLWAPIRDRYGSRAPVAVGLSVFQKGIARRLGGKV